MIILFGVIVPAHNASVDVDADADVDLAIDVVVNLLMKSL